MSSKKKKTKAKAPDTIQVRWKLPDRLVTDCVVQDKDGNWAVSFRTLLVEARDEGMEVEPEGPSSSCGFSLPVDVLQYLEDEAERLSSETGMRWSAMQVAREIWRQKRLHCLTDERSA